MTTYTWHDYTHPNDAEPFGAWSRSTLGDECSMAELRDDPLCTRCGHPIFATDDMPDHQAPCYVLGVYRSHLDGGLELELADTDLLCCKGCALATLEEWRKAEWMEAYYAGLDVDSKADFLIAGCEWALEWHDQNPPKDRTP